MAIDSFGDAVMRSNAIPGDTWHKSHDSVKQDIVSKAAHTGVQVDWEVYGVFSDLLPAAAQEEGGEFHGEGPDRARSLVFASLYPPKMVRCLASQS